MVTLAPSVDGGIVTYRAGREVDVSGGLEGLDEGIVDAVGALRGRAEGELTDVTVGRVLLRVELELGLGGGARSILSFVRSIVVVVVVGVICGLSLLIVVGLLPLETEFSSIPATTIVVVVVVVAILLALTTTILRIVRVIRIGRVPTSRQWPTLTLRPRIHRHGVHFGSHPHLRIHFAIVVPIAIIVVVTIIVVAVVDAIGVIHLVHHAFQQAFAHQRRFDGGTPRVGGHEGGD